MERKLTVSRLLKTALPAGRSTHIGLRTNQGAVITVLAPTNQGQSQGLSRSSARETLAESELWGVEGRCSMYNVNYYPLRLSDLATHARMSMQAFSDRFQACICRGIHHVITLGEVYALLALVECAGLLNTFPGTLLKRYSGWRPDLGLCP